MFHCEPKEMATETLQCAAALFCSRHFSKLRRHRDRQRLANDCFRSCGFQKGFGCRRRRAVVCAYGIELEEIKAWFQNRFQDRKQLVAIDEAENRTTTVNERVAFDLDLAVVLAGFAFEAYNTPPEHLGTHETDGQKCDTIYLSKHLVRELYQGQLTVKLERAIELPGFDLWGTSDPYVWLRVGDCAKQSRTVWATREPVWNETLTINVADPSQQSLQVAAWDANLLSFHRRLGNTAVPLSNFCDGSTHEVKMQLEGMGGGGTIYLQISYKSFAEIDKEKKEWEVPFLSDLLNWKGPSALMTSIFGTDGVKVQDFVGSALGSVQFLNILKIAWADEHEVAKVIAQKENAHPTPSDSEAVAMNGSLKSLAEAIRHRLDDFGVKKLEFPSLSWNFQGRDTLNQSGLEFQARADASYIEKGLAQPRDDGNKNQTEATSMTLPLPEVQKALLDMMGQTEEALGSWLMLAAPLVRQENAEGETRNEKECLDDIERAISESGLDNLQREQMKEMFKRAETAMEAWTILATSLGCTSFVKSEFEKICFLESENTDTQVAVWRDVRGQRLVVAFRGTEQTKWRDLATDLMLVPTGFNPERVAGSDSNNEILVHTGFLTAYDSVRHRLMSIIKASVGHSATDGDVRSKWHIYATGHSLGGALATLLTMDLSLTELFKCGQVALTMYNFGSPRVGNKAFAEKYNKVIKDSWRIVNRRDIIPTVPRLMGYCHVAHPIYLPSLKESEFLDDYTVDVIGEATPVAIVGEFLKGEKQLIQKLLHTEITMLRAIRDGSALMQHMEDFYYISLLERVSSKYNVSKIA